VFARQGRLAVLTVERVVPDLTSRSLDEAKHFYDSVLGLQPVMDHGWIVTLADPDNPSSQISLMTHDETAPFVPDVSIQVDNVDATYAAALQAGSEIVVRRFFVRDPDGHVINVLGHG